MPTHTYMGLRIFIYLCLYLYLYLYLYVYLYLYPYTHAHIGPPAYIDVHLYPQRDVTIQRHTRIPASTHYYNSKTYTYTCHCPVGIWRGCRGRRRRRRNGRYTRFIILRMLARFPVILSRRFQVELFLQHRLHYLNLHDRGWDIHSVYAYKYICVMRIRRIQKRHRRRTHLLQAFLPFYAPFVTKFFPPKSK